MLLKKLPPRKTVPRKSPARKIAPPPIDFFGDVFLVSNFYFHGNFANKIFFHSIYFFDYKQQRLLFLLLIFVILLSCAYIFDF